LMPIGTINLSSANWTSSHRTHVQTYPWLFICAQGLLINQTGFTKMQWNICAATYITHGHMVSFSHQPLTIA
jgi:hypothetical protein